MRKFIVAALLSVIALGASAQELTSVDVKCNLRDKFGIGAGVSIDLGNSFEFSPSFNYYFADGGFFHMDADFHYNIDLGKNFTFYPIVGATYYHADHFNRFGIDLGVGVKYDFNNKLAFFVEPKYQWVDGGDDAYFSLGVKFNI